MKQQTVSQTGVGSSDALVMNTNISPFNVGFGVVVTGTVTYTVQHTFDDPAIGIAWPGDPRAFQLSAKDQAAPLLADAEIFDAD